MKLADTLPQRITILPKISMAGRLANATALPWNLTKGFSSI